MEVGALPQAAPFENSKSYYLSQRGMKNIRSNRAGKEWGDIIKCNGQLPFKALRRLENEWLVCIHGLKKQIGHISLLRPALLLLFCIDDLFGEIAFTFTDDDRVVAVHAKIGNDIFLPQFIIQVHQRNNPCLDKHQERKPQGDPLFSESFQEVEKLFLTMNKCYAKLMPDG